MRTLLISALISLLSPGLLAQTAPNTAKAGNKARVEVRQKAVRQKAVRHAAPVVPVSAPLPSLGEAERVLAQHVYVGHLPCELGASVTLDAHPQEPGYFRLQLGKQIFQMAPVATSTGAIRLEDRQAGAVWLQLANKSMLMSEKLGRRLVDACMNPEQLQVAEQMKTSPQLSVLEDVAPPEGTVALK